MSLLNAKIKRFSLKEVKLPALKERELKPLEIEYLERDPKEIFYNKLINTYPAFKEIDKPKLIALAQRVIEGEDSYSKADIIARIKEATNVSQERAERGFNLILQAGAIELTPGDRYYLTGSTPF